MRKTNRALARKSSRKRHDSSWNRLVEALARLLTLPPF
jgi:hypothetical protein